MDRSRRRSGLLILFLAAAFTAPSAAPPLRALRWLAPGADGARLLTSRPVECLPPPRSAEEAYFIEVGRAAFRTPMTLGGQAARAGVDCETCHRNGRRNTDFHFPGISGDPGTADVTSFIFSSHRGKPGFKPVAIPDLGGPKTALKVNQSPKSADLEHFIHGLVTEEFEGAEPSPSVLKGLAAYVRALSPNACPVGRIETVTLAGDLSDARRAVHAGIQALARKDTATAVAMAAAARSVLGAIAERYGAPGLEADVGALRAADLDLAAVIDDVRANRTEAQVGLETWLAKSADLERRLRRDEARSYYDRTALAHAIAAI
ncbi:MAG TPA: hypothetical protein VGF71_12600 [Caulobacteraceae bacterium]